MINMPFSKCLLAALSVLSCVGAVAPSTTLAETAKMDPEMRVRRALGTALAPSPKDCPVLTNRKGVAVLDCPE